MTKILRKTTNKFVVFYKKRCYDIRKGNIMIYVKEVEHAVVFEIEVM